MRVAEIFYSLQGEGVYTGLPTVFVRVAGCNLIPRCSWCDTSYAWNPEDGKEMTIREIVSKVSKLSPYYKSWVCITGGEPLWQGDELEQLVQELKKGGYSITIETNGSYAPPSWYTLVDSWNADIKCPSSGLCGVSKEIWFKTRYCDQIKFVVGTTEDLDFTKKVVDKHRADSVQVLVSPVAPLRNKKWLQEVAQFCLDNRFRYSLQIHKVIWGDRRGV